MESLKKLLFLSVLAVATADDFWNCPDQCQCARVDGHKVANCSDAGFSVVPTIPIYNDIQILDFTRNNLTEISSYAFKNAELYRVQKLILRDCKLNTIHEHGLSGLDIIELDLSKNHLTTLRNDTFKDMTKLRWMFLNDNQLENLEDGLFSLPNLRILDLSNNKIFQIGVACFTSATSLNALKLDNNRLEYLEVDTFNKLNSLTVLELNGNQLRCDCNLQPFRDWMLRKEISTHADITCAEPRNLRGRLWNAFVCQPDVEVVPTTESSESEHIPTRILPVIPGNTTITFTVLVNGKPIQEIYWGPNIDWELKYYTCGEYLCTSQATKERVVKLSNSGRPSGV